MSALRRTALVLVGLILLSFNLRPAAVSVGPVLEEVRSGLGLNGVEAGLLTSLPVLAFAIFGALAPSLARAAGLHRALALSCSGVEVPAFLQAIGVPAAFFPLSIRKCSPERTSCEKSTAGPDCHCDNRGRRVVQEAAAFSDR